jgi:hypothetical protein
MLDWLGYLANRNGAYEVLTAPATLNHPEWFGLSGEALMRSVADELANRGIDPGAWAQP